MNCNEFRRRLSASVESQDAAPAERDQLRQHAQNCPDTTCRQLWADDVLLADVVLEWQRSVPQVSLAGRVLAELALSRTDRLARTPAGAGSRPIIAVASDGSGSKPQLVRPTRSWLACAASAACLLLLIPLLRLPGLSHQPGRNVQPGGDIVASRAPAETAEDPAAVSEVIRTYAGVPQTATEFVTDTVAMLLPEDLSGADEADQAEPSRPAQWRGRLSEQLEPWGRELGTAFDAFLETVTEPPASSRIEPPQTVNRPLSA